MPWPWTKSSPRRGSGPSSGSSRTSSRASGPRRPTISAIRGGYDAAATDRLLNDWTGSNDADGWSSVTAFADQAAVLRGRARDLERNNDLVNRYLQLMVANVVGPRGIRYQADVKQTDGSPDTGANEILEASFAGWSVADNCSLDGRHSWAELQAFILRRLLVDGEVFLRLVRGAPNDWGFALEPLDADLCDEQLNRQASEGMAKIENGVELDASRRAVAYHFFADESGYTRKHTRLPATNVIHLYMPRLARDTRGVSPLAPVMRTIRMLDGYNFAKVVAARVSAAKMGFFSTPDGEYDGVGANTDGSTTMSAEPGELEVLPPDTTFLQWDPTWPQDDDAFVKGIKRSIAAGLGVSYCSLASDLEGVNYSSIRQGELEQRDLYRVFQRLLVRKVCRRVHNDWLLMAFTSGAVRLPISNIKKFRAARWQERGWQWVDPAKEISAQADAFHLGVKSLSQIAAETGQDLEEVFAQIQRDKELAAKYGIDIGAVAPQPQDIPDE